MSKKTISITIRIPSELKERIENFANYNFGMMDGHISHATRLLLEKGLEVARPDKISGPYGDVAEFKPEDGVRHFGVRPIPYRRTRPNLVLFDVKTWQWPNPALMSGISPLLDELILFLYEEGEPYSWDAVRYRDFCIRLGFDPDENRPKFTDNSQEIGELLISIAIQLQAAGMHSRARIPFDLIDLLRLDTIEKPERSIWAVERDIDAASDEHNPIFKKAISCIDIDKPELRNQGGDVLLDVVYDDAYWRKRRVIERSFFSPEHSDNELIQQVSVSGLVGIVRPPTAEAMLIARRLAEHGVLILEPDDKRIHQRPIEIKSIETPRPFWKKIADRWTHLTN